MAKTAHIFATGVLIFGALITAAPKDSMGALGPLAVVVAKGFPADGISFGDLKRLYMGSPVSVGGKTLVPLTYPKQSAERLEFDESVLGMSADEAGRYWIDRKIRGQSGPPKVVESASTVLKVVTKVDGAIGFVRSNATASDVKVLRIDGKLPSDPGYRVKE